MPIRRLRAGEPVGEDLIHDGVVHPLRRGGVSDQGEVVGVAGFEIGQAGLVEPLHAAGLVDEQPAVAVPAVTHDDRGLPPAPAVGGPEFGRLSPGGFVVGIGKSAYCPQRGIVGGNTQSNANELTERGRLGGDVEGRSVVVWQQGGRGHDRSVSRGRRGAPSVGESWLHGRGHDRALRLFFSYGVGFLRVSASSRDGWRQRRPGPGRTQRCHRRRSIQFRRTRRRRRHPVPR